MSTPEKRARERAKAERQQRKRAKRRERRERGPGEVPLGSPDEALGPLRSIEEVLQAFETGSSVGHSAAPLPTKLFVGGLSYETTNQSLREAFEKFGEVIEAGVVKDRDSGRSRGFGFVTMADRKDAPKAMSALNDSELDGRYIVVKVATERS
ncbi:MAG: RNA-binding protein [Myxococcota bacterium]